MGHLGDFGTEREAVCDTFGYFGHTLRTNPNLTDIGAFEAIKAVQDAQDTASTVLALRAIVDEVVHEEDAEQCWTLARANRQSLEDIATLVMSLVEAVTDRPSPLRSDSSAGAQSIVTKSEDDSVLPALAALEGRPDLQVVVQRHARAS